MTKDTIEIIAVVTIVATVLIGIIVNTIQNRGLGFILAPFHFIASIVENISERRYEKKLAKKRFMGYYEEPFLYPEITTSRKVKSKKPKSEKTNRFLRSVLLIGAIIITFLLSALIAMIVHIIGGSGNMILASLSLSGIIIASLMGCCARAIYNRICTSDLRKERSK